MKQKKWLLFVAIMVFAMMPTTLFATEKEVVVDSLTSLQTAIDNSTGTEDKPTTIRVTTPITVSEKRDMITIPTGKHVQVSGETISKTNTVNGATELFRVSERSSLVLCDITISAQRAYVMKVDHDGKLTLNSGAVINNINYSSGIEVSQGMLILNSGSLIEGTTGVGYGISQSGGSCVMNGGTIKTQYVGIYAFGSVGVLLNGGVITACKTAGVCVYDATCIMKDGMILKENTGASINTYSPSVFTMNGGEIRDNNDTTYNYGGAIFANGGTLHLNGGKIVNNKADNGGALYLESGANVTIDGTVIEKNTANVRGGGIYMTGDSAVTLKSGSILNNSAKTEAGGIIVMSNCKLNLAGGEITGNIAPKYAGISSTVDPITVQGSTVVKNNLIDGTQTESNIFAYSVQVNGTLSGELGISLKNPALNSVLSSGNGYTLTEADAIRFHDDSGNFGVTLSGNNVVLAAAAEEPNIQKDLNSENMNVTQGEDISLSVSADNNDNGVITYQWFVKSEESGNFIPIENADAASLAPDLSKSGTYWYYVQIINSKNGTVKTIDSAVKKIIVLALADYSKVDEAIMKANSINKNDYKDFTAVEKAIAAVVRGKNITEQDDVDAMAEMINKAISALNKKTDTISVSPQTRDISNKGLWFALLFISANSLIALALRKCNPCKS